ncbi:MAG: outer-membrane lipoprotein carrier protein LolA [Myxococcota bacterium]
MRKRIMVNRSCATMKTGIDFLMMRLLLAVACMVLVSAACARRGAHTKEAATSHASSRAATQTQPRPQAAQRSFSPVPVEESAEQKRGDQQPTAVSPGPPVAKKESHALFSLPWLIDKMQRVIDSTSNFSADFHQVYRSRVLPRNSQSQGRVWFQKPGQMRWDYHNESKEMTRRFLVNGNNLWVVDAKASQIHVNRCFKHDALSSSVAFLWGKGELQQTFAISVLPNKQRQGLCSSLAQLPAGGYCLQLLPKQPCSVFDKLVVVVDKQTFSIVETTLIDALDNHNQFVYSNMKHNTELSKDLFTFRAPAGMSLLPMPGSCLQTAQ